MSLGELRRLAAGHFGDLVKAVVDLERRVMIVDADLYADQEAELLADGSRQRDLWGTNPYPDLPEAEWLEFDSMMNLRPSFGNRTRGVDDPATRDRIGDLVRALVIRWYGWTEAALMRYFDAFAVAAARTREVR